MKKPTRTKASMFRDDPTVAEVRRWRATLMRKAGGTVEGLMDLLDRRAAERAAAARPSPGKRKSKKAA